MIEREMKIYILRDVQVQRHLERGLTKWEGLREDIHKHVSFFLMCHDY